MPQPDSKAAATLKPYSPRTFDFAKGKSLALIAVRRPGNPASPGKGCCQCDRSGSLAPFSPNSGRLFTTNLRLRGLDYSNRRPLGAVSASLAPPAVPAVPELLAIDVPPVRST